MEAPRGILFHRYAFNDKGECTGGVRHCISGQYGPCEWQKGPSAEICDGKDNDCDGSVDDDLAMALKAPNVRIVAPLPGKSTVGVEVPNTRREIVPLAS